MSSYNKKTKKAISVLSGGLDSTVATSFYKDNYDIHAITFDYGQRSVESEIHASKKICEKLGFKHSVIALPWLSNLGNSALTSEEKLPLLSMDELDDKELTEDSASKVWVPGRNIVFTAIATSYAEAEDADIIIVGWDKEEANTFPDNSKEFLESFNDMIYIGTKKTVEIKAPAIDLNKKEIVELGKKVDAPLELSYSCYTDNKKHCGICESCLRRKRAFIESEIADPTEYLE
ncbi:7-cyano-7-deazaguanine synthase [Methanobrevibacter cuticularis]|uniref:7-cyano-7-deazaguanine synthase n=1 Tax=Methanobrevibacter cuticularis TaxID=47311 RepID=A0A166F3R8_9EURY|nr:7-cyano-7-deazaguanine synthase QueC [Methanobrevibacter cuticularis]KZX17285.1 7-cyano-7-deazaguanine synthase [Methanobrevibacter cuticularis]